MNPRMKSVMVSYTVKPECAEENAALIAKVLEQIEREKPHGLSYTVARQADGVSFVHLSVSPLGEENPQLRLPAFERYREGIGQRVVAPPTRLELETLGHFSGLALAADYA